MSSEVETSRDATHKYLYGIPRLRFAPLGMTPKLQFASLIAFVLICCTTFAQDSPTPSPIASLAPAETPSPSPSASPARSVRLRFVPPPMEGTISLGIFDEKGKLVRVLHREAKIDNFSAEADGLSTTWDGKNDVGGDLPPGKYRARGYAVGQDIKAQHIAYFFNDFVTDQKSTRFGNILQIWYDNGQLRIAARRFKEEPSEFDINGKLITEDASIPVKCEETPELPQIVDPITCDFGKDETLWVLDHAEKDSPRIAIRQFSKTNEPLREIALSTEDPQPNDLAASDTEDRIYLLEENDAMQRLRSLTFTAGKNDYKVDFEKKIVKHEDFTIENGKPIPRAGEKALPKIISTKLVTNPLLGDTRSVVDLRIGFDNQGSFIQTTDGLPLCAVSKTPNLVRVLMTKNGEKSADVWEDDRAVVEQFRVSNIDKLMAFDCGFVELK